MENLYATTPGKHAKSESHGSGAVKLSLPGNEWWKTGVIYQIYPQSFFDGRQPQDGIGDLKGIEAKIDYLRYLGVNAVWLNPIYKSPMVDYGYDISDYRDIEARFGTMTDFRSMAAALRKNGIHVIMDCVPNHTSDQHDWFIKSVARVDPFTDYYVWKDPSGVDKKGKPLPPNNWVSVFRGPAWEWNATRKQFYLHQFCKEQPDLDFTNPLVVKELCDVLRFWMANGVDGFRLDAVAHMFEDPLLRDQPRNPDWRGDPMDYNSQLHTRTYNLPEVLSALRQFRVALDGSERHGDNVPRCLLSEAYLPTVDDVLKYYGTQQMPIIHLPFNFSLFGLERHFDAWQVESIVDEWMVKRPQWTWLNWVVGNHDNPRVASRLGRDCVDMVNMLLLMLPGVPVIYYGDEIGMVDYETIATEDICDMMGRDPERTPMQWNAQANAGFTTFSKPWLPVNPNYKTVNVALQQSQEDSHLNVFRKLVQARSTEPFSDGGLFQSRVIEGCYTFLRYKQNTPSYAVVLNPAAQGRTVDLMTEYPVVPSNATVYVKSVTKAHTGEKQHTSEKSSDNKKGSTNTHTSEKPAEKQKQSSPSEKKPGVDTTRVSVASRAGVVLLFTPADDAALLRRRRRNAAAFVLHQLTAAAVVFAAEYYYLYW